MQLFWLRWEESTIVSIDQRKINMVTQTNSENQGFQFSILFKYALIIGSKWNLTFPKGLQIWFFISSAVNIWHIYSKNFMYINSKKLDFFFQRKNIYISHSYIHHLPYTFHGIFSSHSPPSLKYYIYIRKKFT